MTCISDVPYGVTVTLYMRNGKEHTGKVIANYGACLVLKIEADKTVSAVNDDIARFDLIGKESVDAFEINVAKEHAKFQKLLERIKG